MNEVILFAGTTEGKIIAEACKDQPVQLHVCVATEYGATRIEEADNIIIHAGRKDQAQMERLIGETGAGLVFDATHPYATEVTETIKKACEKTGAEYVRLLRAEEHEGAEHCIFVKDTQEAAEYIDSVPGNVLLTVGSKELEGYTKIKDYKSRLFARILPLPQGVEQAAALGFQGKNLICMQGPFTEEMNAAMLKMLDISYLVTKDTGSAGGFPEKLAAARSCGAKVIVVSRPSQEEGLSLEQCLELLAGRFGLKNKKDVTILGTGTGSEGMMTFAADKACREAELIIGAKRLTESLAHYNKPCENAILPGEIAEIVKRTCAKRIVIAMSGDTGFYSGTKKLLPLLEEENVRVLPGISSVVYFCSRLGTSWDDALLISTHGRNCNYIAKIRKNPKVITLTGGDTDAAALIAALCENGLGGVKVTVGADLSYETESIVSGTAQELCGKIFPALAVILAENPEAEKHSTVCGLPDEAFIRADVPMTKQEVRAVTLAKLMLTKNAVCWDVGAGTGSVSLEMAECCEDGMVYAIEQKEKACELIEKNKLHLGITNVKVVPGKAPEALETLPAPTHVFIGGSSGNQKEIFDCILRKNPNARVVINTVTAESFAEVVDCLKTLPVRNVDILQLSAARGQKLGRYHLMTAQNPVFIISFTGGKADE